MSPVLSERLGNTACVCVCPHTHCLSLSLSLSIYLYFSLALSPTLTCTHICTHTHTHIHARTHTHTKTIRKVGIKACDAVAGIINSTALPQSHLFVRTNRLQSLYHLPYFFIPLLLVEWPVRTRVNIFGNISRRCIKALHMIRRETERERERERERDGMHKWNKIYRIFPIRTFLKKKKCGEKKQTE